MLNLHSQNPPKVANRHHLLIVEDDRSFRETLCLEFEDRGYLVSGVGSMSEFRSLPKQVYSFAIVDLRVGQENGISFLEQIQSSSPHCRTVILTGYGSISTAVSALRQGAKNYLTKPVSMEQLERALWIDSETASEDAEPSEDERTSLARHEREYIEYVLERCEGNISKAAQWLGVHRQSLQRKLRKYPPKR